MKKSVLIFSLTLLIGSFVSVSGQTTYTWDGGGEDGKWTTPANWNPDRNAPALTDILVFSNAGTLTVTDVPAEEYITQLKVTDNSNVELRGENGIVYVTGEEGLLIETGSVLTLGSNILICLPEAPASAKIAGTMIIKPGGEFDTSVSGTYTEVTVTGKILNNGGNLTSNVEEETLFFNSGSEYEHAMNGGAIPWAKWDINSLCRITGVTSSMPSTETFNQLFGNFEWNCPYQTSDLSFFGSFNMVAGIFTLISTGSKSINPRGSQTFGNFVQSGGTYNLSTRSGYNFTLTIIGDFTKTGGTLNLSTVNQIGKLEIAGDFTHTGGTITETSTGSGAIVFNGTGTQVFTSGGTVSNTINFTVNSGSTLQMGTGASPSVITGDGSFTLSSGATLIITSPDGITSSDSIGNIQVTGTRTYNQGANYVYSGSGAQQSGNGLPSTLNGNLTVSEGTGLEITQNTSVNGTLTVSGTLDIGTNQLTVNSLVNYGSITINSTSVSVNGSMIASSVSGTGSVTYNRQLIENNNKHYFSSPVGGLSISAFKSANSDAGTIWEWDEDNAVPWQEVTGGNFVSGKGYNIEQAAGGDGKFTFTGSVVITTDQNPITFIATAPYSTPYNEPFRDPWGGGGWHMLGNPYTSAMDALKFISDNSSSFDPNYLAVYIYDGTYGTRGRYFYIASSEPGWAAEGSFSSTNIQAGQGFFVLAKQNGVTFSFMSGLQVHNTTVPMTKSGDSYSRWPGLNLKAKFGENESSTIVVYGEKMTAGLDPGYDVGLYSAGADVEIYTKLVEDNNGFYFARQALPVTDCDEYVVPVGIDCSKGSEITFTAETEPVPGYGFYLEDRLTGKITDLTSGSYTTYVPVNTYGTGRFYLYATKGTPTGIKLPSSKSSDESQIWYSDGKLNIRGIAGNSARCTLYNLQGLKIMECRVGGEEFRTISLPELPKGVYIVRISDGAKLTTKKIVVM